MDDLKRLRIIHKGFDEIGKAISTTRGVHFDQLNHNLMLSKKPGIFFAAEMLNWHAPTGGYLITAALATGLCSAKGIEKLLSGGNFSESPDRRPIITQIYVIIKTSIFLWNFC